MGQFVFAEVRCRLFGGCSSSSRTHKLISDSELPLPPTGEVKQLFVDGGWWKASEIPPEDLASAEQGGADAKERTGCLISEVVVPGFSFEDHAFLDEEGLEKLAEGDGKLVEELREYVRPTRQE